MACGSCLNSIVPGDASIRSALYLGALLNVYHDKSEVMLAGLLGESCIWQWG